MIQTSPARERFVKHVAFLDWTLQRHGQQAFEELYATLPIEADITLMFDEWQRQDAEASAERRAGNLRLASEPIKDKYFLVPDYRASRTIIHSRESVFATILGLPEESSAKDRSY